ncbi:hypothetical protein IscW_ISCW003520 [Ixodes scapularis]|uniref:Uncharacterized protein n=1 Tax=Ixodes scapularis TaxID=6945 RepID=B7PI54_IXOSC|nr:hypothetical protein IscW_ISCW003520 [Ixodes scapularis]|eukprot:XP_002404418.1 hypothetical protein IscW_ISCW003520 [Ixodes scapularis]
MDVVQVEGQELRPDEFGEGSGWCEIKRNKTRADSAMESAKTQQQGHQQTGATSTSGISTVANKAAKYERKNARKVSQIAIASRMPDLPTDDYRVVVRPRGDFNVSDHKTDRIYCCLRSAAEIGREAAEEGSICLNVRQNVVVLSTPSEDRAYKYGAITKLRIREREYEASAYRAAPENTSKGLVRGISKDETQADIVRSLVTKRNPSVLHAKRMGNTDNVIVLFERFPRAEIRALRSDACQVHPLQEAGRRVSRVREAGRHRADVCPSHDKICRGCGCSNPLPEHRCKPKCLLCGKGHVTGDRKCKAKYKMPYLVKRRQWERIIREEKEAAAAEAYGNGYNSSCSSSGGYYYASEDRHLGNGKRRRSASRGASGGAGKSRSRSRARSGARSRTGSRTSRPRSKSTTRGGAGPGAADHVNRADNNHYGSSRNWQQEQHQLYCNRNGQQQQKRQMVLTPPPPPPLPPRPVPAEVTEGDGGSVETTDEPKDRPVSSKRVALDPERPAPEPSGSRFERLKKRVENIEKSLDERFARQTEQINEMFNVVNNSVAQLAEQLTQALATLTARMDDVEARPLPVTGRPIRAPGKPYARPHSSSSSNPR